MTTYFCWVCEQEADTELFDVHYESNRVIYFCCVKHKNEYEEFKAV